MGCEANALGTFGAVDSGNFSFRFELAFSGSGLAWLLLGGPAGAPVGRGRLLNDPILVSDDSFELDCGDCDVGSFG